MFNCGRCGKEAGIGGFGNHFRIFEWFIDDGQKYGRSSELCDDCQRQLVNWLFDGGYEKNRTKELPVLNSRLVASEMERKREEVINLIADMVSNGATKDELSRAITYSATIIDAEKSIKRSAADNCIAELKNKYSSVMKRSE